MRPTREEGTVHVPHADAQQLEQDQAKNISSIEYGDSWDAPVQQWKHDFEPDFTIEIAQPTANCRLQFGTEGKPFLEFGIKDPWLVHRARIRVLPPAEGESASKLNCSVHKRFVEGQPEGFAKEWGLDFYHRMDIAPDARVTWGVMTLGLFFAELLSKGINVESITPLLAHPLLGFATAVCGTDALSVPDLRALASEHTQDTEGHNRLLCVLIGCTLVRRRDPTLGEAVATKDGMPLWDAELADRIEAAGDHENAGELREARRGTPLTKAWELWYPQAGKPSRAVQMLARCLWHAEVWPQLERERRKPPALVVAVHEPATHLLRRAHLAQDKNGQLSIPIPGDLTVRIARDAATIGASAMNAIMVDRGVKLLGSVAAHRVFRDVVFTAHQQALEGNPDPRLIRFDGGWRQYAEHLGMPGKKAADQVRDIIEAMHGTEIPLPTGTHTRLLIREYHPPRGQRKGRIILTAGPALLPDYVQELQHALRGSLLCRRAAKLVPVLPIPPMAGHEFHHGAQATFSMMLVGHFREHAADLAERGCIELDDAVLRHLADAAGLSWARVHPILDHWTQNHPDGPALLAQVGNGYTLGDAHKVARDFIIEGGKRELNGAEAGRKANARKARAGKRSPK